MKYMRALDASRVNSHCEGFRIRDAASPMPKSKLAASKNREKYNEEDFAKRSSEM